MNPPFFSPFRWTQRTPGARVFQFVLITFVSAWLIVPQQVWACACSEVAISSAANRSELDVDSSSGTLQLTQEDIDLVGYAKVNLTRTYDSLQNKFGMFGYGWDTSWVNNLINASGDIMVNLGGRFEVFLSTNSYYNADHSMQLSFVDEENIQVESRSQHKWFFSTANLACTKYVDPNGNAYLFDTTVTNHLRSVQGGTNVYQKVFLLNRITFPDSREVQFEYTSNLCTRAISPDGRTNVYSYTDGLLTGVARDNGMALDYGYHTSSDNGVTKGWLTSMAYANGAEVNISYNDEFNTTNQLRVVEVTGPHGYIHSYGYQVLTNCGCSLATTVTDSRNNSTIYVAEGVKKRSVTNALGYVSTVIITNGVASSQTDMRGNTEYYVYDSGNTNLYSKANLVQATNRLNQVWRYGYDINNYRVRSISPMGRTNSLGYDAYGNLVAVTNALSQQVLSMTYSTNGLVASVTDGRGYATTFARNDEGLVTNTVDALTNSWKATYDVAGNKTSATDPVGNQVAITYSSHNKPSVISNALGNVTTFSYDEMANVTNVVDSLGNGISTTYDQLQRRTRIVDALGHETRFSYDPESNMTVLSNALGQAYNYSNDAVNQVKTFAYPDASKDTYTYDGNGNQVALTNRSGQVITAAYDAEDRMTFKTWEGATNCVFAMEYNDADLLTVVTKTRDGLTESAITNTWDTVNRLTKQSQGTYSVEYSYGLLNYATNVSYPSGISVGYSYDPMGRASAIRDSTNATAVASYEYDAAGRLTKRAMENGIESVYAYDGAGRVTNMALRVSATPTNVLWSVAYGYDAVGNRLWVKNKNGRGDVYQYDATYQVTGVKYDVDDPSVGYASATNPSRTVTYNWDALGNRTSVVDNGNSTSYSINNLNQYTTLGATNLTYDTRGNLTGDGVWTFAYDQENHLIGASKSGTTASYAYDGLGRRISKTVNGTTTQYIYSGANLLEERDGSGTVLAKYEYEGGVDRPVKVTKGGNAYYIQQDALGNVVELLNASGQVAEQYSYDVFGAPTIKDGSGNTLSSALTPFLFTGREWDSETGLYHYRARAYSAALGRFLQADPIDFNGGDTNLYRYCANNPINSVDPSGLAGMPPPCVGPTSGGGKHSGSGSSGGGGGVPPAGGGGEGGVLPWQIGGGYGNPAPNLVTSDGYASYPDPTPPLGDLAAWALGGSAAVGTIAIASTLTPFEKVAVLSVYANVMTGKGVPAPPPVILPPVKTYIEKVVK